MSLPRRLQAGLRATLSLSKRSVAISSFQVTWDCHAAALFDAVANYALVRMLLMNEIWSPYPELAAFCATDKFVLLSLGLFYASVGWLWPKKWCDIGEFFFA